MSAAGEETVGLGGDGDDELIPSLPISKEASAANYGSPDTNDMLEGRSQPGASDGTPLELAAIISPETPTQRFQQRPSQVRIDDSSAKAQLAREDDSTSAPGSPNTNPMEDSIASEPRRKKGRQRAMTNAALAAAALASKNKDLADSTVQAFGVATQLVNAFVSDMDGDLLDSITGGHLSRVAEETLQQRPWTPVRKSEARERALRKRLEDLLYNGRGLGARLAQMENDNVEVGIDNNNSFGNFLSIPGGVSPPNQRAKGTPQRGRRPNPHPLDAMFSAPESPGPLSVAAAHGSSAPSTGNRSNKSSALKRRGSALQMYLPDMNEFDKRKGANGMGQQQLLEVVAAAAGRIPKHHRGANKSPTIQLNQEFEAFGAIMTDSDGSSQYSDMDDARTSRASSKGGGYLSDGTSPKKRLELVSPKKRKFPMIDECKQMIHSLIQKSPGQSTRGGGSQSPTRSGHPLYVMVSPAAGRANSTATGGRHASGQSKSDHKAPLISAPADREGSWNSKGVGSEVAFAYHSKKPYSAADVSITTPQGEVLMDGLDSGSPFSNTGLLNRHCCYALKLGPDDGNHVSQVSQNGVFNLVPSIQIGGSFSGGADTGYSRPCKPVTCRMKPTLNIPARRSNVDYSTFCGKALPGSDDAYDRQARAATPPANRISTPRRATTPQFAVKDDYNDLKSPAAHHTHMQQGQLMRSLLPAEALEYMGVASSQRGSSTPTSAARRRKLGIEPSMSPTSAKVTTTEFFLTSPDLEGGRGGPKSRPTISRGAAPSVISPAYARLKAAAAGRGASTREQDEQEAIRAMLAADQRLRDIDADASSCSSVAALLRPSQPGRPSPHRRQYHIPYTATPTVADHYPQRGLSRESLLRLSMSSTPRREASASPSPSSAQPWIDRADERAGFSPAPFIVTATPTTAEALRQRYSGLLNGSRPVGGVPS